MGFLDNTVTSNSVLNLGSVGILSAQTNTTNRVATPSSSVVKSIATSVNAANTKVAQQAVTQVNNQVNTYLKEALQSLTSVFGGKTNLASGISGRLSTITADTNVASASTTTTQISDPIYTNILQAPVSGGFKTDSLETGSQLISVAGSGSSTGTLASSMTGTSLTTLLNRFNLDSTVNLPTSVTDAIKNDKLAGLYPQLITTPGGITVAGGAGQDTSASLLSDLGLRANTQNTSNDLSTFLGKATPVSDALGSSFNPSSYFLSASDYTLSDESSGAYVDTNGSGVDADTANAVVTLLRAAGCDILNDFKSVLSNASLFNLGLNLAALNGMKDVVESLLGCSNSRTLLGQTALGNAFVSSSNSQLSLANVILASIDNPTALNTRSTTTGILTNANLTRGDATLVNTVMTGLGTTSTNAMSVAAVSSSDYSVYDISVLSGAQPGLVDGLTGDTITTDYLNGYEMTVQDDGAFTWV